MKFKLSTFLISSAMLAACGGGGSSDSNTQEEIVNPSDSTKTPQIWETVRIERDEDYNLRVTGSRMTFIDGKAYAIIKDENAQETNELYLTENGEYQTFGPVNSNYGALMGDMTFINNQIKLYPYSQNGSKGFELTTTVKELNLEGENVLAVVDPKLNWQLDYPQYSRSTYPENVQSKLIALQKLKFPAGSVCLQETEYSNNQDYLLLTIDGNDYQKSFEQNVKSFDNQTEPGWMKKITGFNTAIAYHNKDSIKDENAYSGYAQYQNKYYPSFLENQRVEFNLSQSIEENKQQAQLATTAEEKSARLIYAESLNKGCDTYNTVAAAYLDKHLKL